MFNKQELNKLYRYATSLSGDDVLAYDLVHDAVVKMSGRFILKKNAYAKQVIRTGFYDYYKKEKSKEMLSDFSDVDFSKDLESLLVDKDLTSETLAKVSPKNREILYLLFVEEYTYKELSKFLDMKQGTILSTVYRLKKKLQEKRGDNE